MNLIRGEVIHFEHARGTSFDRIEAWSKDYMVVVFKNQSSFVPFLQLAPII
jgi:hypothetical protein